MVATLTKAYSDRLNLEKRRQASWSHPGAHCCFGAGRRLQLATQRVTCNSISAFLCEAVFAPASGRSTKACGPSATFAVQSKVRVWTPRCLQLEPDMMDCNESGLE